MIAVRDGLLAEEVVIEGTNCESTWAKIELKNQNPLYVGAFYRQPRDNRTDQVEELE